MGFFEFVKSFTQLTKVIKYLREQKSQYEEVVTNILKDYQIPKNKYLKEYVQFLEENQKVDSKSSKEICQRIEFEEMEIPKNLEQDKLRALLTNFFGCPENSIIKMEWKNDEKGLEFSLSGSQNSLFVSEEYVRYVVYSQNNYGTMYSPNSTWVGNIINRVPTSGTHYFKSGDRFEGQYNGHGTMFQTGGSRLVGSFQNGQFQGSCTYYFSSGNVLECNFSNGDITGSGTIKYANGSKWVGNLTKTGNPEGYGTFYRANGCRWEGNFPSGYGTMYFPQGDRWTGYMQNQILEGSGTYYKSNGEYYVGQMSGGQMCGNFSVHKGGKISYGKFANGTFYPN